MSPEGWHQPRDSRGAHYFRRARSLCGRYGLGPGDAPELASVPALQSCGACLRKKRREAPAAGGAR